MAQTYQMKHNPQGTIYSLLTVESDGQMTMTFHGTDREICHEATQTEDGRIATGGSLFPGLESGRWNKVDDGRWKMEDGRWMTDDVQGTVPAVGSEAESERTTSPREPRPRRQRKQRKPRVERQPSDISPQTSDTLKAIGMVAAATVALFVIYETGLLIPMGLIGLATGGLLK